MIKKMKNKFLSCLLAVVMVASLLVMPATAANTIDTAANSNIVVDLSAPTSVSDESVTYSNGMINLASEKWAEYTVNATAAGSYHIKFTRPSANRTEFYVNGEHITWRGGRKDDAATSTYELLNEVQLIKGANTIRVVAQSGKVGSISALNLVGLTQNRHTLQIHS